ncbi:alpha/beta-hydrolase [Cadophora sp. DSE1049]|nr:alpha/beta-hydrolase [Cadophora sp. DSE1049]
MTDSQVTLRVPYKYVNDTAIPTDIHLPTASNSGSPRELSPVIIMIHGGGFMLGHSQMNNRDQIDDCTERGWIVLSVEHRLCPGVNLLNGPVADVRDVLQWAQDGGLAKALQEASSYVRPDPERVMAMGTSSGGHLALSLAWAVPKPPLAILDFYGAKDFTDVFWTQPIESIRSKLPPPPPDSAFAYLYAEKEAINGGVSLEGQAGAQDAPPKPDLRQLFTVQAIGNGTLLEIIWPDDPKPVDPVLNVHAAWPPTAFVHGTADLMIPLYLSRNLEKKLIDAGIETEFHEVVGEPHTFAGKMVKGSPTWDAQRKGFDFLEKILQRSYS